MSVHARGPQVEMDVSAPSHSQLSPHRSPCRAAPVCQGMSLLQWENWAVIAAWDCRSHLCVCNLRFGCDFLILQILLPLFKGVSHCSSEETFLLSPHLSPEPFSTATHSRGKLCFHPAGQMECSPRVRWDRRRNLH